MSDIEELKRQASESMKRKKDKKKLDMDMSLLKGGDSLVVLSEDEVELFTNVLWDVLEGKIYPDKKRTALNALKHMGELE